MCQVPGCGSPIINGVPLCEHPVPTVGTEESLPWMKAHPIGSQPCCAADEPLPIEVPKVKRANLGQCAVCGSTATKRRVVGNSTFGVIVVCVAHEFVCRPHLKDPCPECEGAS